MPRNDELEREGHGEGLSLLGDVGVDETVDSIIFEGNFKNQGWKWKWPRRR